MALALDLSGQTALITGGTKGIGLAIARNLGRAGARIAVVSRKQAAVDEARKALHAENIEVIGISGNVGSAEDRVGCIQETVRQFGGLDILVNNAAANPVFGKVEDTEPAAFGKIMEINLHAPFELAKLALPYLKESSNAHVINISSIGGLRPEPKLGIYSVSKAALNSLTKVLAKEWGRYGIQVHAVCPGLIKTDFSAALWSNDKLVQHMKSATPLQRIGDPEDIGKLVAGIAAGIGAFSSGHVFVADGGYTI